MKQLKKAISLIAVLAFLITALIPVAGLAEAPSAVVSTFSVEAPENATDPVYAAPNQTVVYTAKWTPGTADTIAAKPIWDTNSNPAAAVAVDWTNTIGNCTTEWTIPGTDGPVTTGIATNNTSGTESTGTLTVATGMTDVKPTFSVTPKTTWAAAGPPVAAPGQEDKTPVSVTAEIGVTAAKLQGTIKVGNNTSTAADAPSQVVATGATPTLTAVWDHQLAANTIATGTITYKWEKSADGGTTWENATEAPNAGSGAAASSITLDALTDVSQPVSYRCTAWTGSSGTAYATGDARVIFTLTGAPTISVTGSTAQDPTAVALTAGLAASVPVTTENVGTKTLKVTFTPAAEQSARAEGDIVVQNVAISSNAGTVGLTADNVGTIIDAMGNKADASYTVSASYTDGDDAVAVTGKTGTNTVKFTRSIITAVTPQTETTIPVTGGANQATAASFTAQYVGTTADKYDVEVLGPEGAPIGSGVTAPTLVDLTNDDVATSNGKQTITVKVQTVPGTSGGDYTVKLSDADGTVSDLVPFKVAKLDSITAQNAPSVEAPAQGATQGTRASIDLEGKNLGASNTYTVTGDQAAAWGASVTNPTANGAKLQVTVPPNTAANTYTFTITGQAPAVVATVNVKVVASGTVVLDPNTTTTEIQAPVAGQEAVTQNVTFTGLNLNNAGTFTANLSSTPAGVTVGTPVVSADGNTLTVPITATSSVAADAEGLTLTVQSAAGPNQKTGTATVDVLAPPTLENADQKNITAPVTGGAPAAVELTFEGTKLNGVTFAAPVVTNEAGETITRFNAALGEQLAGSVKVNASVPAGTAGGTYTVILTSTEPAGLTATGKIVVTAAPALSWSALEENAAVTVPVGAGKSVTALLENAPQGTITWEWTPTTGDEFITVTPGDSSNTQAVATITGKKATTSSPVTVTLTAKLNGVTVGTAIHLQVTVSNDTAEITTPVVSDDNALTPGDLTVDDTTEKPEGVGTLYEPITINPTDNSNLFDEESGQTTGKLEVQTVEDWTYSWVVTEDQVGGKEEQIGEATPGGSVALQPTAGSYTYLLTVKKPDGSTDKIAYPVVIQGEIEPLTPNNQDADTEGNSYGVNAGAPVTLSISQEEASGWTPPPQPPRPSAVQYLWILTTDAANVGLDVPGAKGGPDSPDYEIGTDTFIWIGNSNAYKDVRVSRALQIVNGTPEQIDVICQPIAPVDSSAQAQSASARMVIGDLATWLSQQGMTALANPKEATVVAQELVSWTTAYTTQGIGADPGKLNTDTPFNNGYWTQLANGGNGIATPTMQVDINDRFEIYVAPTVVGLSTTWTAANSTRNDYVAWEYKTLGTGGQAGGDAISVPTGMGYYGVNDVRLISTPVTAGMDGWQFRLVHYVNGEIQSASQWFALQVKNADQVVEIPEVTISSAPAQTNGTVNITETGSVTFTADVQTGLASANLAYQWQKRPAPTASTPAPSWEPVPDATDKTYTIPKVETALNDVSYRCVVSNQSFSGIQGESNVLTLKVDSVPGAVVINVPNAPAIINRYASRTASFAVEAGTNNGDDVTYQWYMRANVGPINTNAVIATPAEAQAYLGVHDTAQTIVTGATSATYETEGLKEGVYEYVCRVSNAKNPQLTATSAGFFVVVTQRSRVPYIVEQPADGQGWMGVVSGSTATLSCTAAVQSQETLTYQWQASQSGSAPWTDLTGQTSSTLRIPNITGNYNTWWFRCVVHNTAAGTTSLDSNRPCNAVQLIVWDRADVPVVGAITRRADPTDPTKVQLVSTARIPSGAAITAQWTNDDAPVAAVAPPSVDGDVYTSYVDVTGTTGSYTCTWTNGNANGALYAGHLPVVKSNTYVYGTPTPNLIRVQPVNVTAAVGTTATFQVGAVPDTLAELPSSLVYVWQRSTDGGITWKNCTADDGSGQFTSTFSVPVTQAAYDYATAANMQGFGNPYTFRVNVANRTTGRNEYSNANANPPYVTLTITPGQEVQPSLTVKDGVDGVAITTDATVGKILSGTALTVSKDGHKVSEVKDMLSWTPSDAKYAVRVVNAANEELSDDDIIGTGCKIQLIDPADGNKVLDTVTVVVRGDVMGNGTMSLTQLVRMAACLKSTDPTKLEGAYLLAGDLDGSGAINLTDLVQEAAMYRTQILNAGSEPTPAPTTEPSPVPTTEPSAEPTTEPTTEPSAEPTAEPTTTSTAEPTPSAA